MGAKAAGEPRGWEFGDIVWEATASGKLIFFSKQQPRERYQLNLGGTSDVLDVHKTSQNLDGTKSYETVFAMRKEDLPNLLEDIGEPMFQSFARLLQPLRLGWLFHRRIAIVQGLILNEADARRLARRRRRRLVIDEETLRSNVVFPEFLEDIYDFEDGPFLLLQLRRRAAKFVGVAIKATNALGFPVLRWIKLRDVGKSLSPNLIRS
jgi:hypothetical protein